MKKHGSVKGMYLGLTAMIALCTLTGCQLFTPPATQPTGAPETTVAETVAPETTVPGMVTETESAEKYTGNLTPAETATEAPETTAAPEPTTAAASKNEFTIDETVVYEGDGVKITAVEAGYENSYSPYGIKFLIENNTDKDLNVGASEVAINGYYVSESLYATVGAGKKVYSWLAFYDEYLEDSRIETIGTIDMWLSIYDKNTYDGLLERIKGATIETSAKSKVKDVSWEDSVLIYDDGGIVIRGISVGEKDKYYTYVSLYIENNSGRALTFSADNVSVNGFMINGYMYSPYIVDGYKIVTKIEIDNDDLADSGITSMEEAELSIIVRDENFDKYATIDVTIG